jgi:hypothetical protein
MQQPPDRPNLPPRNPTTHARHRREVFWQITAPLLGVLILLLVLVGLVIWSGVQASPEVGRWADISLVWLIVPAMIGAFLFLLLLSGITFGVIKLIQVLPPYARLAQDFFLRVQARVSGAADRLVRPIVQTKSTAAGARRLRDIFKIGR